MELLLLSEQTLDLIVIGGGAAGFMAAITAAEDGLNKVVLLELTSKTLEKVRISGGGRCNVTNACWNPSDLVLNYPRGKIPLLGPFNRFATEDSVSWFAEKGLRLIKEADGRMFPISNSSSEVVDCLRKSASEIGVNCYTKSGAVAITKDESKVFIVKTFANKYLKAKRILLATGSHPSGRAIAESLGHKIVPPVPSLFSFSLDAPWLVSCSGLTVDDVSLELLIAKKSYKENGRILITHKGLSGPAVLKLSAFAARILYDEKYQAKLKINWLSLDRNIILNIFRTYRYKSAKSMISNDRPFPTIPKRLWINFLIRAKISPTLKWADLSARNQNILIDLLSASLYSIKARGPFGEEFVTAGGVKLSEVNLINMQSRLCPGLHFAGEILDVDGITGGFNFQHCWTSGWLAGKAIAQSLNI